MQSVLQCVLPKSFVVLQSLSAAIAFFYSEHLGMKWQLLILVITGTLGACTFFVVEWAQRAAPSDSNYDRISEQES